MKALLYTLLLIVGMTGCTSQEKTTDIKWKERNLPEATLVYAYDSLKIDQTFHLISWNIKDNRICFVTSGMTDRFLSLYEYPGNKKLFECGKIGQGPGEFITLNAGEATDGNILLYDIMGRKALIYALKSDSLQIINRLPLYNDEEGLCKPFTFITQIDRDNYLMKIDDATASSWEIANLREEKAIGSLTNSFRKPNTSYTPFDFIQCIHDTTLVVASAYADRIEYYSIKANHIRPLFAMGSRKDQSELKDYDDLMAYYLSVVSQSGYFYCLKSTSGTERGNLIEVYDSEGKAVACHMLDKEVSSVRFDSEGNLVGYVPDINQTLLYQFRLDN